MLRNIPIKTINLITNKDKFEILKKEILIDYEKPSVNNSMKEKFNANRLNIEKPVFKISRPFNDLKVKENAIKY